MGGLRKFLTKSPAGVALVILVVLVGGYFVATQLSSEPSSTPTSEPSQPGGGEVATAPLPPAPGAKTVTPSPAPAQKPTPGAPEGAAPQPAAKPAPSPTVSSVVPPGPKGRSDPFTPLMSAGGPVPPPPLATLPPPPLPGAVPPGTPPVGPGGGIVVTGIAGNSRSVAVVVIDGQPQILSEGESIGTLLVVKIDSARRLVRFSRGGSQFDVRMGGE